MRRGTGYTYGDIEGDSEDCISYKCEGCGRRVRVTPAQARHFRGSYTACSSVCILKARDLRTQQVRRVMDTANPAEGASPQPEAGAAQECQGTGDNARALDI